MHHGLGTLGILPFSVIKHAGHKGSNFKKTDIVDSIRPYFNKRTVLRDFLAIMFLLISLPGSNMNRIKRFGIFRLRVDIRK